MANDQAKQLLQQGIAAARAGDRAQARQLLQEAVKRDPRSEPAWLWLSSVAKDDQERLFCLKQLLGINPNNENAIKGLKQLGVSVGSEAGSAPVATASVTSPSVSAATPTSPAPTSSGGIPLVDEQKLAASIAQLDPLLQRYQAMPTRDLPFAWARKKRGRAGDSSATLLRAGVIGGVVVAVIVVLVLGLLLASKLGVPAAVAVFSTQTPTSSPTATFTATAGVTDTPSPTPKAPLQATALPLNVTKGDPYNPQPTPLYPPVNGQIVPEALALANAGNYDAAIAKLEGEQKGLENVKGPDYDTIIYYLALTYVNSGNADRALAILDSNKADSAIWHAAEGAALYAKSQFDKALPEADQAFKADNNLISAAVTEASILAAQKDTAKARQIINQALSIQGQGGNTLLLNTRGSIFLAEGNFKDAESDALVALYADPLNKAAYILRGQVLLAKAATVQDQSARIQAYGDAVLAAKDFLLYYPNETAAWLLLGQGRAGEQNFAEALNAYSQAVVADKTSPDAQNVFVVRGKLYLGEKRYQEAFDDFDKVLTLNENSDARQGHLQAALALKNYSTASTDAAVLLKANPADPALILTQADLLILNQKYDDANAILTDQFVFSLDKDAEAQARAHLYKGIIRFEITSANTTDTAAAQNLNFNVAFNDITASLDYDSGLGHYFRAQVSEALGQPALAIPDYQWVLYWDQVYHYDFTQDATKRLQAILDAGPKPTPSNTPRGTLTLTKTPTPTKTQSPTSTIVATQAATTPAATDTDTVAPSDTPTATSTPSAG